MSTQEKNGAQQSLTIDDFFYFFFRVRKPRIRYVVDRVRTLHPDEGPEEHARRLIQSQGRISYVAGTLFHAPVLIPGLGTFIKACGVVGGASALTRVNLYLILEIAHLFGKDIDETNRVPEMAAVIAATGVAVCAPPLILRALHLPPVIAIPAAGLSAQVLTRIIGETAMRFYRGDFATAAEPQPTDPVPQTLFRSAL